MVSGGSPTADIQTKQEDAEMVHRVAFNEEKDTPNDMLMAKHEAGDIQTMPDVQREADGSMTAGPQFSSQLSARSGFGIPLPNHVQKDMDQGFGRPMDHVRVHFDAKADEPSRSINARAFTHKNDIYFKQGQYDTHSTEGKKLLAHEMRHTLQQGEGIQRKIEEIDPNIKSALQSTTRGSEAVNRWESIPTLVTIKLDPGNPPGKLGHTQPRGNIEEGGKEYAKKASVKIFEGALNSEKERCSNPATGGDTYTQTEGLIGVGVHESWHLDPGQMPIDQFGFPLLVSEIKPIAEEYQARKEYKESPVYLTHAKKIYKDKTGIDAKEDDADFLFFVNAWQAPYHRVERDKNNIVTKAGIKGVDEKGVPITEPGLEEIFEPYKEDMEEYNVEFPFK